MRQLTDSRIMNECWLVGTTNDAMLANESWHDEKAAERRRFVDGVLAMSKKRS